jgi:hypothetical protein
MFIWSTRVRQCRTKLGLPLPVLSDAGGSLVRLGENLNWRLQTQAVLRLPSVTPCGLRDTTLCEILVRSEKLECGVGLAEGHGIDIRYA